MMAIVAPHSGRAPFAAAMAMMAEASARKSTKAGASGRQRGTTKAMPWGRPGDGEGRKRKVKRGGETDGPHRILGYDLTILRLGGVRGSPLGQLLRPREPRLWCVVHARPARQLGELRRRPSSPNHEVEYAAQEAVAIADMKAGHCLGE